VQIGRDAIRDGLLGLLTLLFDLLLLEAGVTIETDNIRHRAGSSLMGGSLHR
jgi:hypothetical protein